MVAVLSHKPLETGEEAVVLWTEAWLKQKSKGRSKLTFFTQLSIERDATLLANRIALLKQEEMKTWKKIEETKKRANEVVTLKRKNEERAQ